MESERGFVNVGLIRARILCAGIEFPFGQVESLTYGRKPLPYMDFDRSAGVRQEGGYRRTEHRGHNTRTAKRGTGVTREWCWVFDQNTGSGDVG